MTGEGSQAADSSHAQDALLPSRKEPQTMTNVIRYAWTWVGVFLLAGCIWPGDLDQSAINRYQRAMMSVSPQKRMARHGLDMLRPAQSLPAGPELKTAKDPKTGRQQVFLSLDEAIIRTLGNNQDIQVVSYDPAVAREELIQAAAEFDAVVFGAFSYDNTDRRANSIIQGGQSQTNVFQAGLRKRTITGAQWQAAWTWTRSWDNVDSAFRQFSPSYEPTLAFEISQPLLRDGWPEVNLARFRVAALNEKSTAQAFRQKVEEIIADVISTYWQYVQTRLDYQIQKDLLAAGEETHKININRRELDASEVNIRQSEAAVESRRAALIRSAKLIQDLQDRLVRLMADKRITLLGDFDLVPTSELLVTDVKLDVSDQLLTALKHNPVMDQARLAIQAAEITVRVAKNQTLPRLDLQATGVLQGLDGSPRQAQNNFESFDHASYSVALALEYPLGNREREAELRKRRFEKLKSIAVLQNLADQLGVAVKERVRQIGTTYQEMLAQRRAAVAAEAQLKALDARLQAVGGMSPTEMQLKLQSQELIAVARRSELEAMVQYNVAQAELSRVTGTILRLHGVDVALPVILKDAQLLSGRDLSKVAPAKPATVNRPSGMARPVAPPNAIKP
ncbi:MAG: Outer membrane efflux protein [Planctomycetes bacterium ADurb.Bin126]|nr:MAG: Outer membrane efflux protein [Planctomycetes bacterium ADurb.Bin126]